MDALNRDLHRAVADLAGRQDRRGRRMAVLRLLLLASRVLGGSWAFWTLPAWPAGAAGLLIAGLSYALLLEMVHGTLLGMPRLEFVLGCLLSWPMAWPFAT